MTIRIDCPIHLIGIGCGGSYAAMHLAKKGRGSISELHAWDGDCVDLSNTMSQTYSPEHVGLSKVEALGNQTRLWGDVDLIPHTEYVENPVALSGYVIVGVDKMSTRKTLWEQSIKGNKDIVTMIEMRLETTGALIHVVDPNNPAHIRGWERYWYPDDEATTAGSCGTATSLGPIASLAASLCVWQLVRAVQIAQGLEDRLDNQIRVSMIPLIIKTYQW